MAPSGAGPSPLGCVLLWLLAVLASARGLSNTTASAVSQCSSLDDTVVTALSSETPWATLGPGCHILTRNYACTPIRKALEFIGSENGESTWDTSFDLYQFSLEPGVVVTLRNLVVSRALIFTAVDANLQPYSADSRAFQLAVFHMRPGSRLVLQNVVVVTRCSTLTYYWMGGYQAAVANSSGSLLPPLSFSNTTIGVTSLINVTVRCNPDLNEAGPVDLYVHTVPMLSAFLAAASALSVRATVHLQENLTLPYVAKTTYTGTERLELGSTLITADAVITGDSGSALTYVDANYTTAWLTVRWPAQLTLRQLVLTRLHPTLISGSSGVLAGALPLEMIRVSGTSTGQARYYEDVTLIVPQYEVVEMTYWCIMFSVGAPELKSVADFLRPFVWPSDFDVISSTQLYLRRVKTGSSVFTRVVVTSELPAGVPAVEVTEPPAAALSYPHVRPPLYLVSTGREWVDAVSAVPGGALALPIVLLINGTVTLQPSDFGTANSGGGNTRVLRRSLVVTSLRQGSGGEADCQPAVLDLGGMVSAVRLEGPNTTVAFVGVTLVNAVQLSAQEIVAAVSDPASVGGFFQFDKSAVRISMESVTMKLRANEFAGLYRLMAAMPRGSNQGDASVISMNESVIQLASFLLGGVRGNYVSFTLLPGTGDLADLLSEDIGGRGGGYAASSVVPIVVGSVVGGVVAVLLLTVGTIVWRRRAQQRRRGDVKLDAMSPPSAAVDAAAKRRDSRGTSRSGPADLSLGGSGKSTIDPLGDSSRGKGGTDGSAGGSGPTRGAAPAAKSCSVDRGKANDEESPPCTTFTVSELNSSDTATIVPMPEVPSLPPLQLPTLGPAPGREFPVARSVPEESTAEAEAEASLESSGRGDRTSQGSGSTSAGGVGRRLLAVTSSGDAATVGALAGAPAGGMRCQPRTLPCLLDSPAESSSGRGSVGGGGGGGGGQAAASSSGASARRMTRVPSGGRTHLYVLGEGGRASGLRVRAALGRSPSRPARSAASSGCVPSTTLPAPQPAVLAAPSSPCAAGAGPGPASAPPANAAGAARPLADRSCHNRQNGRRRELSHPALVSGNTAAAAASAAAAALAGGGSVAGRSTCTELGVGDGTVSHSVQLIATGGTLDGLSAPNLDEETCSPAVSNSLSKVPEPASEVQRLIQELATHGTDQLVILEPIGQGGYGMVYRGVWRNLDVAVKTVLFQDRANLGICGPLSPGCTSVPSPVISQGMPARGAVDGQDGSQQALAAAVTAVGVGGGRDPLASGGAAGGGGGGGCGSTHNWALASQQAANSGSLLTVNMGVVGAGGATGQGPLGLGIASQQRAVLEAAVSCSLAHPNVVATYHFDITPIRPSGAVCSGGLLVSNGSHVRGSGGVAGGAAAGTGSSFIPGGATSDWKLYLVQEFCDAGSLANALDARAFHDPSGMPNLAMTLCVLADIARGMAHIHSRSIVHGDLNPTNILLRSVSGSNGSIPPMWNRVGLASGPGGSAAATGGAGSGSATPGSGGPSAGGPGSVSAAATLRQELGVTVVAKIADFGLCGMLTPGKRHISNAMRGTPFYTAPETVATGTLTKASDVYSFGVIAWEVYTGRPPFQHVFGQGFVRDEGFPRLPRHVPATFANMALACLSGDPDARPTFNQILDRLMALQSKLAVSLQQRLSRLMASSAAMLGGGGASPLACPATAASTPPGVTTPTSAYASGACAPGSGMSFYRCGATARGPANGGCVGGQWASMPQTQPPLPQQQPFTANLAPAMDLRMGAGAAVGHLVGGGGGDGDNGTLELVAVAGGGGSGSGSGVSNLLLSMPPALAVPSAATQQQQQQQQQQHFQQLQHFQQQQQQHFHQLQQQAQLQQQLLLVQQSQHPLLPPQPPPQQQQQPGCYEAASQGGL